MYYFFTGGFLTGKNLDSQIVNKIRQQTIVLIEYVQTLYTDDQDSQFFEVQRALKILEKTFGRVRNLKSVCIITKIM